MEGDEDERTHRRDGAGQVGRSYAGMEAVAGGRTPGCRRERDAVAAVRIRRRGRRSRSDAYAARWRTPKAALNGGHGASGRARREIAAERRAAFW
jgi:hypothetical protein